MVAPGSMRSANVYCTLCTTMNLINDSRYNLIIKLGVCRQFPSVGGFNGSVYTTSLAVFTFLLGRYQETGIN